ncbi:RabGAP/TBC [Backusella circina FSU 941]|nr:RabGAP/TBC [Backusella circina FSU 941]
MKPKQRKSNKKKMRKRNNKLSAQDDTAFNEMNKINYALKQGDFALLRDIGKRQGFISDAVRRRIWPFLLHAVDPTEETYKEGSLKVRHKDEDQVMLDVKRSFSSFPPYLTENDKTELQEKLNRVIIHVLRAYPSLHYYQGFHDICSVFLLLFGEDFAKRMMETIALFYLRDAMFSSLEPILRQLTTINTIIGLKDPALSDFISEAGVLPYYCLSWVITWCSHDLSDLGQITRLFDLFLCSNPFMVMYFSAAVVLSRREEIMKLPSDDMSIIHSFLTKLPQDLDLEAIIQNACLLEREYSPFEIQCQSTIALDTTSCINTFEKHFVPIEALDELNQVIESTTIPILKEGADEKQLIELNVLKDVKKHELSHSVLQRLLLLDKKEAAVYTLFAIGAGVGLLSVIMSNSDLAREWVFSLQ